MQATTPLPVSLPPSPEAKWTATQEYQRLDTVLGLVLQSALVTSVAAATFFATTEKASVRVVLVFAVALATIAAILAMLGLSQTPTNDVGDVIDKKPEGMGRKGVYAMVSLGAVLLAVEIGAPAAAVLALDGKDSQQDGEGGAQTCTTASAEQKGGTIKITLRCK